MQDQHQAEQHDREDRQHARDGRPDSVLSPTTVATSSATMQARSGMSYQRRVTSGMRT